MNARVLSNIKHKGYVGEAWIDDEAGVIRGRVIGTRDVITFQGETVVEARQAFVDSVDDYLDFCEQRGEKPEKPYSGKILLRVGPDLHRALSIAAENSGQSINALVLSRLKVENLEGVGSDAGAN
jgi:predicted HicB family RNase H-like nuclease